LYSNELESENPELSANVIIWELICS
jgi:hypothetical protein